MDARKCSGQSEQWEISCANADLNRAQVFDSYAGTIGYAAVTDAGAEHSWIPFSSALYIKCRDNRIFRMFADKQPSILTRAVEKQEGNAAYVIPLPFTRFAFCFAYSRNYVVLQVPSR